MNWYCWRNRLSVQRRRGPDNFYCAWRWQKAKQLQAQKLEFDRQQRQFEFQNVLDNVKIDKETAVQLKHFETARLTVVRVAQDKKYIPRLPPLHPKECLHTFLGRFSVSMKAA